MFGRATRRPCNVRGGETGCARTDRSGPARCGLRRAAARATRGGRVDRAPTRDRDKTRTTRGRRPRRDVRATAPNRLHVCSLLTRTCDRAPPESVYRSICEQEDPPPEARGVSSLSRESTCVCMSVPVACSVACGSARRSSRPSRVSSLDLHARCDGRLETCMRARGSWLEIAGARALRVARKVDADDVAIGLSHGTHAKAARVEHADCVEGARKVRKDGIRRRVLHVRAEDGGGQLSLESPYAFPPGRHEHTTTQKTQRAAPGPKPGSGGCNVRDERRSIGSAAVDAAEKMTLRVRHRGLLGCRQRGQDSVGVLAYVVQLPFGGQARSVKECAESPRCARALEVQIVRLPTEDEGRLLFTGGFPGDEERNPTQSVESSVAIIISTCWSPVASQVPRVPSSEGVMPGTYLREGRHQASSSRVEDAPCRA